MTVSFAEMMRMPTASEMIGALMVQQQQQAESSQRSTALRLSMSSADVVSPQPARRRGAADTPLGDATPSKRRKIVPLDSNVEESEEDVFIPGAQAKAKARLQSTIGGKTSGVPPTPITSSTKSAKKERTQAIQVAKAAVDSKAHSHPAVRPTPQSPPLQPTNAKSAADVSYILAHRFVRYVFLLW